MRGLGSAGRARLESPSTKHSCGGNADLKNTSSIVNQSVRGSDRLWVGVSNLAFVALRCDPVKGGRSYGAT